MKYVVILLLIMGIVLLFGCEQKFEGLDKDGCIRGAGYSWSEDIGACVREGELDDGKARAAKIAVLPMSIRPITVSRVETQKCVGCYDVFIKDSVESEEQKILIRDWKISENEEEDWQVSYEKGILSYSGRVIKQTPCHAIDDKSEVMGGDPVRVRIKLNSVYSTTGKRCAQVLTEESVEGQIEVQSKPDVVTISYNGVIVYPSLDLSKEAAIRIAKSSYCADEGEITDNGEYNHNSDTWWIDIDPREEDGCNPVCVVYGDGKIEVNMGCS